jgi:hypothetical protein
MTRPHKDSKAGPTSGSTRGTSQEQLEMAQRIAREMLREDHQAFQVSVRNGRG